MASTKLELTFMFSPRPSISRYLPTFTRMMSSQTVATNGSTNGALPSKTAAPDPLGFMTRLNESVYVYRPASTSTASSNGTPRLVLLCTWMGAQPVHIAKYVRPYTELYPNSPVVLVRSEMRHFVRPKLLDEVQLGADALSAEFPELGKEGKGETVSSSTAEASPPPLLIHLWSNGGSTILNHIAKRLPAGSSLPRNTIVFDSCPGQFRYKTTHTAMLATLPPMLRLILSPAVHLLCIWWWVRRRLGLMLGGQYRDPLARMAAAHNTPERLALEVRRSYIYSVEDALIPAPDVEAHAADAKSKGANVRLELFKGVHVGHLRTDPDRYWKVVTETYAGPEADVEPAAEAAAAVEEVQVSA